MAPAVSRGSNLLAGVIALLVAALVLVAAAGAQRASAAVLLVCNTSSAPAPCPTSGFHSIQSAVDAAAPGDWILVWPGDYHEKGSGEAGVMITKPDIHLRGMDRNGVIVDGTNPGSLDACPSGGQFQDTNANNGRNGIEVSKTDGTYIENLTVCNYLSSPGGDQGNEIWWNGGDGSGKIGMGSYWGSYLTTTSTYFKDTSSPMGMYGLFSSNDDGPASIDHTYASNMGDSDYYIGACQQVCNQTIDDGHAEHSTLGFSGTNAGGNLVLKNSEWDDNKSGIVPNSLNNDDAPPPQDGACPGTTNPCMTITGNHVHDNNDPDVPASGIAGEAPVGTGIEISGGAYDKIESNTVDHNDAWGIVTHDFPDTETPPPGTNCQGGTGSGSICFFSAYGNVVQNNTLHDNGGYGNPTNGDLANEAAPSTNPRNCFSGNNDPNGLTSDPPMIQTVNGPPCNQPAPGDTAVLAGELVCDAAIVGTCGIPGAKYPSATNVTVKPLEPQPTMPNPCDGVPPNPFCPASAARPAVPSSAALYPIGATPVNLGLPHSRSCSKPRRLAFRLRRPTHDRITSLVAYVNGKRAAHEHGKSLRRITIKHVPRGTFVVRIVARTSSGRVVESTRRYRRCKKTKPRTRAHR